MDEAKVRGYQVALQEQRVQLVLSLASRDAFPTESELRTLAHVHAAIEAFEAVLQGEVPGEIYQKRTLK